MNAFPWPADPLERFRIVAAALTALSVLVVAAAVVFNFVDARRLGTPVEARRWSPVATGTMTAFFVLFWALVRFRLGTVAVPDRRLGGVLLATGTALVVAGAAVNVLGRLRLGANWADHVTLYRTQTLVEDGVFGVVRHPLYASLIWMFYGASLEFANVAAALATTLVFVPMMAVRARLEERVLAGRFPGYADYARRVGRFVPRPPRRATP